jgi:hypothetical protein
MHHPLKCIGTGAARTRYRGTALLCAGVFVKYHNFYHLKVCLMGL